MNPASPTGLNFAGGGGYVAPQAIAIDASGSFLSGSSGFGLGAFASNDNLWPNSIAIDGSGNVWVLTVHAPASSTLAELSNSGTLLSGSNGYIGSGSLPHNASTVVLDSGGAGTPAVAADGAGNVWVASNASKVAEFIGVATPVITPVAAALPAIPTSNGTQQPRNTPVTVCLKGNRCGCPIHRVLCDEWYRSTVDLPTIYSKANHLIEVVAPANFHDWRA